MIKPVGAIGEPVVAIDVATSADEYIGNSQASWVFTATNTVALSRGDVF
ncbi:MAG: hypothetical protein ABIH87_03115 [bacterium]